MRDSTKKFRECCSLNAPNFMKTKSFLNASLTEKEFRQLNMREPIRGKSAGGYSRPKQNINFAHTKSGTDVGYSTHHETFHGHKEAKSVKQL